MTSGAGSPSPGRDRAPAQVRWAGLLVGLEALLGLAFVVVLVVRSIHSELGPGVVLGEAAMFAVLGLGLAAATFGLLTGRRAARTPAIVAQLLLLPVVYSLIGSQLPLGIAAGAVVISAFLLLISEPSRVWSMAGSPRR